MIIGVDIGTSVTKASLLRRDGTALVTHSRRSTLHRRPGGRVEHDPAEVLDSARAVIRDVAAAAERADETVEA
ncbi:FGGY family carbohydrate kinase, partial [Saccharomonospora iraqiensis]|uniref:FGGY family carbohydrate kinase n=1 Tax=Saccharomonospora iraqiensis TaxID=52698 RepID=UPI00022E6103